MPSSLDVIPALPAFLAGGDQHWRALRTDAATLLDTARQEHLAALIVQRLPPLSSASDWPASVRAALEADARVQTCEELARGAETRAVIAALADAGVRAIVIKGTALAYSLYDAPACRARVDTDLFVDEAQVDVVRHVFSTLGYQEPSYCSDLFAQFEVERCDGSGIVHLFDVHGQISTQPAFQTLLRYSEALSRAQPLPALGPRALTLHPIDALLLACVHPVMHHRNEEPLLWLYDLHLLAGVLSEDDFDAFGEMARAKGMATICLARLRRAETVFKTTIPSRVTAALADRKDEPSTAYLASERTWRHELVSSVHALPTLGARARLLRQVLLPTQQYMLGSYGLRGRRLAALLLPALYLHRNLRGAWKIVAGKK